MSSPLRHFAIVSLLLVISCSHTPQSHNAHAGHELGVVHFPVSCSPQAQAEFTHAMAVLHHMTYPQARLAFEKVVATDPKCAMAHWGIAMTLFQPLWPTRPGPDALQRGWDEVSQAKALGAPTERERLFIQSAEAFFLEPKSSDYWLRIQRWEKANADAYAALPDDPEIAAFYALSHLATTPASRISRDHADRAAEILLRIYRDNPQHPGAMHYLVHANDVPGRERELLDITRKYESLAPRNPHALHMPTHIYTRLGDWDGVIRGNLLAAEAALEHPAGPKGEYVWDEFAHAIEYLIYAYLQKGDDVAAAAQLKRLRDATNIEPTFKTAFHLASTQSRYALERRAWSEAAALTPPSTSHSWPEAIVVFAQGLGAAHTGALPLAHTAVTRLDALEATTRKSGEELFARNIRVLSLELSSWIAHAEGESARSVDLMREAVALEGSTPKHAVTPGPTLPATELLGDLLLEHGDFAESLLAYKRTMELYPRRLNTLIGAARAARGAGDVAASEGFMREALALSKGGARKLE
ncbi:MAG TPA: hypothetical protein VF787_23825 [Thermoanaerobaculia bacterium]